MHADSIPSHITQLTYSAPGPALSQNQAAALLAHYWPAIEQHIRHLVSDEILGRPSTLADGDTTAGIGHDGEPTARPSTGPTTCSIESARSELNRSVSPTADLARADELRATLQDVLMQFEHSGRNREVQTCLVTTRQTDEWRAVLYGHYPRGGTTFPAGPLPAVPDDGWNVEKVSDTDLGEDQTATTVYSLDAPNADDAELRLLAWISHVESDPHGATATATSPDRPGTYTVYLTRPNH
ncbi:hypothetical protein OG215_36165 (plasmid) [Streptomyces globisporus]|uniref:hypothetical protein n=1 Tax=Streptomyces globisporus TaxID=1908 RepID=UPI002F91151E|nr:hypothetical protein OG215_36165 [Streptomyces globisporus]